MNWTRVGLLTLGLEYIKAQQEFERLKALRDAAELAREREWAEREAAWDRLNRELAEMTKRIEAIEIK